MKKNKKNKSSANVPYEVLNEEDRTIEPVYDAGKSTRRRRGLAWFLGLVSLVGLGFGAKKLYDDSDWKYNNEIKSAYVRVYDTLEDRLPDFVNTIDAIRFYAPEEYSQPAKVHVFATTHTQAFVTHHEYFYNLAYEYYQTLKAAEATGDFKAYVEVLNACFEKMEFEGTRTSMVETDFKFDQEQAIKFNEMFSLSVYGYEQVGFLPQYISYSDVEDDEYFHVTYVLKGYSFVKDEDGDGVLPSNMDNAILSEKINKNKIKVFETDYTFTFDLKRKYALDTNRSHIQCLLDYFNGGEQVCENLKAYPSFVHEVDLAGFKMQNNVFDFDKPEETK